MMKNALVERFEPKSMLQSDLQWIESENSNCIECNSTYCAEEIPDDYMEMPDYTSVAFDSSTEIEFDYDYSESNSSRFVGI